MEYQGNPDIFFWLYDHFQIQDSIILFPRHATTADTHHIRIYSHGFPVQLPTQGAELCPSAAGKILLPGRHPVVLVVSRRKFSGPWDGHQGQGDIDVKTTYTLCAHHERYIISSYSISLFHLELHWICLLYACPVYIYIYMYYNTCTCGPPGTKSAFVSGVCSVFKALAGFDVWFILGVLDAINANILRMQKKGNIQYISIQYSTV